MSREFTMGIRLNYYDNDFTNGVREAERHTRNFSGGLDDATNSGNSLVSSIGALAAALGTLAAVKGAYDWMIESNAQMESYENTLTVVMKSHEKAIETLAWANKFAATTPFEIPEIVEATTRMASYGMSAQKTLGIVGDMASVMGKDLMQAVEAVADAQTGELERLKEFGITKKMIEDQAKMLGSSPINSKGQITDAKAFNAALFSLMEVRFKGGMAMQAKTFKGMMSNVQDFMGTLGRNLGKPIFDQAKRNLESFLGVLNRLNSDGTMDRMTAGFTKFVGAVFNEMAYARKVVTKAFQGMMNVSRPVFDFLKKNWNDIKPFVQGVGIAIGVATAAMVAFKGATILARGAMILLNASMLNNPVGWIILGIGLLIGLFIKMNGGIDGAKNKLLEYWGILKGIGSKIAGLFQTKEATAAMGGISEQFAMVKNAAMKYWPQVQAVIDQVTNFMKTDVLDMYKQIATDIIGMFKRIWTESVPVLQQIAKVFMDAWEKIAPVLMPTLKSLVTIVKAAIIGIVAVSMWLTKTLYKLYTTYLPPVINFILKVFSYVLATLVPIITDIITSILTGFNSVVTWFKTIWPALSQVIGVVWIIAKTTFEWFWTWVWPFVEAAIKTLWSIIKGGFDIIVAIIKGVWGAIKGIIKIAWSIISGIIQTALGILTGDWQMAWDGFKSIFTGVWDGITEFLGSVGTMFYDVGKTIMNTLADGIKNTVMAPINAVKGVFDKIGEYLPHSDAKKGPLSTLTYSGGSILTTMGKGVQQQAAGLSDTVRSAFNSLGVSDMSISAAQSRPGGFNGTMPLPVSPAAAPGKSGAGVVNNYHVGSLAERVDIHTQPGDDAESIATQLIDVLHRRASEAVGVLATANKGALLNG